MSVLILAEAGSNWRVGSPKRDLQMAKLLIDVAVDAGADVVKFQTYRPETVYVKNAGRVKYMEEAGVGEEIGEIFSDLSMPYEMLEELHTYATSQKISLMSTPFSPADFAAVDPYVKMHKIASYEITHLRLLELAGRSGKPLLLSTAAATEEEIAWALEVFRQNGGKEVSLLQCTVAYPTPPEAVNLQVLPWLKKRFQVPVGLSDHSRHPTAAPLAAVALGATVIEKHYTLDNRLPGPDHHFALLPQEFAEMVRGIRLVEKMLGTGIKQVEKAEQEMHRFGQRALQALCDIQPGQVFVEGENVAILRPGVQSKGIHPKHLKEMVGKRAKRFIPEGAGIQLGDWS